MSEEASTVMLIHPAPGANAKNRLKAKLRKGTAGLLPISRCRYNRADSRRNRPDPMLCC
jgi:hypothetical protein